MVLPRARVFLGQKSTLSSKPPAADLFSYGTCQVVMTRVNGGESADDYFADFDIALQQK